MVALHASGQTFPDFVAAAKARREGWVRLADSAQVDPALVQRARAAGRGWRILVVAIDACGDSMTSVPDVARLAVPAGGATPPHPRDTPPPARVGRHTAP